MLRRLDHLSGIAIVDVDHRRAVRRDQVGEQPQLGGEIVFDGLVIIEMVAREVGEGAGGDAHAVEPVLVEAVRGRFERQMRDALARQRIERAVQLDRIGRGQRAVFFPSWRDHADGADAGGWQAERGPDLPREGGDRGLAAGAGDGGDCCGLAREKARRGQCERAARIGDLHEGDIVGQPVRALLGGDRRRARRDRLLGEMRAVGLGPGDGDEQKAGFDLAAVGGNAGEVERGEARLEAGIVQRQIGELHVRFEL